MFKTKLERYKQPPDELLRVQSLKDKMLYVNNSMDTIAAQTSNQNIAMRKRSNKCLSKSEYDSDSSGNLSTQATNVQDLPGYMRPAIKRRKINDPRLIISNRIESKMISPDADSKSTPIQWNTNQDQNQDSTTNKHLQMSASKVTIPGKMLSDSIIAHRGFTDFIAESINNAFEYNLSCDQLPNKLSNILATTERYPTFDDIVQDVCPEAFNTQSMHSSLNGSKPSSEPDDDKQTALVCENRQLDTPIPNDSNRSGRYELRSHNKSATTSTTLNTSTESKRKKSGKAEIISDERVNIVPQSAIQTIQNEPILIESDSEGTVTTTSQQQSQQFGNLAYDSQTQRSVLILGYIQPSTSTTAPMLAPMIGNFNFVEQSQIQSDQLIGGKMLNLENYIDSNILQSNQIVRYDDVQITSDSNQIGSISNDGDIRIVVVDDVDVEKEGNQSIQLLQQNTTKLTEPIKEKFAEQQTLTLTQQNQVNEQKQSITTPKQLIKSTIPSSTRSLSTPRNRNPHVRVLDFNTPSRFRLMEIIEDNNELQTNTARFFNETPQNHSITSSIPNSAPPKINSIIQSRKMTDENMIETIGSEPTFVPINEDTVVSTDGETPKVRKMNRKSCVRTISAHKESNPKENEKRLKRVAKTKKKICQEDGESNNDSDGLNKNEKIHVTAVVSKEDAAAEWEKIKSVKNNPELFEQNLREQISKKQEIEIEKTKKTTTGKKPRSRRPLKKSKSNNNAKVKPVVTKAAVLTELVKSVDVSMNSTLDLDNVLDSTLTNLEAQMLEENLKSAKKATPIKQEIIPKSVKKKTPMGKKLQIKLMPSPKNKALRRLKSKKFLTSTQTLNAAVKIEPVPNTSSKMTKKPIETRIDDVKSIELESSKRNENTMDDLEVAQNLINMNEVILQQENQRKKSQTTTDVQIESVPMPPQSVVLPKTELMKLDRIEHEHMSTLQPNLNLSSLLETPFKDNAQTFPKTPGMNNVQPHLVTP